MVTPAQKKAVAAAKKKLAWARKEVAAGRGYASPKPTIVKKVSTSSEKALARQRQQSEAIERWKRGEISKEQASALVKKIIRGGGTGVAADPRKYALALEAERKHAAKIAVDKARLEAERKIAEKQRIARELVEKQNIAIERQRIKDLQRKLQAQNAQEVVRDLIDAKTRDKVRHETLINRRTGERIFKIINLRTGEVRTRTYEKRNGRAVQTGGLIEQKGVTPKVTKEQIEMTRALNTIEKELPKGVRFHRDKVGNIINIDDKIKGINVPLEGLMNYVEPKRLVALGLATIIEAPKEVVAPLFQRIKSAISPKKARERREKQRQKLYDFYRLTGKNRNIYKLINAARTTPLNVTQQNQFNKIVLKNLKEDLLSEDTKIRAEIATVIAAIAGGVLIGGAVGSIYKTPIALAKDLGADEKLGDITWREVAKKGGVEFGVNAAQAYVALKLFGLGTKAALKIPALARFGLTRVGLQKSGILTQKVLKIALKRGLNVVGAEYLSSIGIDVAKLAKVVKEKKYKAATIQASGLLGTLVGFYGEKSVRGAFRKLLLREDPRLIKTAKPFAIESRDITVARLDRAKIMLRGKKIKTKIEKVKTQTQEQIKKEGEIVYHATKKENIQNILKKGLLTPSESRKIGVTGSFLKGTDIYVTKSFRDAQNFAKKLNGKILKIILTPKESKEAYRIDGFNELILNKKINPKQISLFVRKKIKVKVKEPKLIVKFVKATPVKEPKKVKIVTPEKRVAMGVKIDVPTPAGYATYAVGKDVYIVSNVFLKIRKGATPKTYITEWLKSIRKKGVLPTLKELGIPRLHSPTLYKGSGEYLPRHRGESLKKYYARALRVANKRNIVQVVVSPKTVLGAVQKELEIKTIYPNPRGIKASVTRVNVGKDVFGNTIVVEIVAPKSVVERMKFKLKEKIKFKIEALKYLTKREAKIARDLAPRVIENWNYYYVKKLRGHKFVAEHSLRVERNVRRIVKEYKIKLPKGIRMNKVIRLTSRLHDILKLRGLNVKDEPTIRKMIKEGYLDKLSAVKNLRKAEKLLVADTIGYHQDVNPRTIKALMLNKFTKAFINADRLDITRYGKFVKGKWIPTKINPKKLFNLKAKSIIPKKIRTEFIKLTRLKIRKRGFTSKLRKRYSSLLKKFPGLRKGKLEERIMAENKKKFRKLSPRMKRKYEAEEREYTDYKEAIAKYKRRKKIIPIPYKTSKYKSYKYPKYKAAYKSGYTAGYKYHNKAPSNYKTNYGKYQSAYASGYKAAYKGNYKINYKTGKYAYIGKPISPKRPSKKPPVIPKGFTQKKLKKAHPVYYVVEKVKGKFKKLYAKPLTLKDAKDYAIYSIDNRLSRTAFFIPLGKTKNVVKPPKNIASYYSKNGHKVRPYKIKYGKKKQMVNGFIEKRAYTFDQPRERVTARKLRRKATIKKAKRKFPVRRVVKRKI